MMGAGGITEIIACVQSVRTGLLPPTLGLTDARSRTARFARGSTAERTDVHVAISNAMGFGGQNCCIDRGPLSGVNDERNL